MNIYPSTKVRPYVYFGFNPITGEFYIGYREANTKPSHIDLFEYRTSSDKVKAIFDRMIWSILAEFEIGDYAFDFEQQLIADNWGNPLLLNEQYRLPTGKKRFKSKKGINKGNKFAAVNKGKSNLSKGKPRGPQKNPSGPRPNWKRIAPAWNKGKTYSVPARQGVSTALKGQTQPKVICPHCSKEGGMYLMKRYHFENCKENPNYSNVLG